MEQPVKTLGGLCHTCQFMERAIIKGFLNRMEFKMCLSEVTFLITNHIYIGPQVTLLTSLFCSVTFPSVLQSP